MAAHQALPPLGFSRQEHWSGLPFPSPKHESEKWKWSRSVVSDSSRPNGLQPTRLLRPWDFPGKSTGVGCHCLLRLVAQWCPIFCNPRLLCPWNSPGKNTWVGSHSLLQGLNPVLLHCRWILYHPSHQGSRGVIQYVIFWDWLLSASTALFVRFI